MMDMIRPGKTDEQIHIEEVSHASSSAARTMSLVMTGAPGPIEKAGKPSSLPILASLGAKARRMRSETTCPSERRSAAARARAATITSSSRLIVVRMRASERRIVMSPHQLTGRCRQWRSPAIGLPLLNPLHRLANG
jgi:hypothetical protein